jgi:probable phosphomutase (TIGR03848 family)
VTLVLLVRHGLTAGTGSVLTGRLPGIGLDDRGRAQAAAVGARLADVPLDAIISSPLQRCRETAAAIAAARSAGLGPATPPRAGLDPATPRSAGLDPATPRSAGLDPATPPNGHQVAVTEDDRFAEVAYGDWTGKPIKRLVKEPLWRVVQAHPSAVRFPGPDGESLPGVQERAVAAIRDWNERLGRKAVYLVCSHGDVIKSIIADSLGLHLDMFQRIQVDPCSVSLIRYTPLRPFVLRMNDAGAGLGGVAGSRPALGGVAGSGPAERGLAKAGPAEGEPGPPGGAAAGWSGVGEGDAVIGGGAGG